jgi:carboxymethylenebutenolidase
MSEMKNQHHPEEDGAGVSRREFLEQSAGIAGGTALLTTAAAHNLSAQEKKSDQRIQRTPPRQSPQGEMVQYKSGDKMIPAYFSRFTKNHDQPCVIVIHEVFGLNEHIKSICNRLAVEGYAALAPDLFVRASAPPPKDTTDMAALRKAASSIPNEVAIKDMQAGLDHLKTIKGLRHRFGSIGFCMGGGYSYQLATHTKDLSGAAIFYGRTPLELVPQVSCPLLCSFGELDQGIPPEKIKEFEQALSKAGKTADIKIYPGAKHGFFNDTRPEAYNASAAADAWQRTVNFFRQHLMENRG